jgi:hypothetical protein
VRLNRDINIGPFIGISAGAGAEQYQSVDLGSCIGESNQFVLDARIDLHSTASFPASL